MKLLLALSLTLLSLSTFADTDSFTESLNRINLVGFSVVCEGTVVNLAGGKDQDAVEALNSTLTNLKLRSRKNISISAPYLKYGKRLLQDTRIIDNSVIEACVSVNVIK